MSFFSVKSLWARYQTQLQTRPYRTQIVTSTVLWAAGDVIAQTVSAQFAKSREGTELKRSNASRERHDGKDTVIDWRRVLITSGFGTFFVGPVGHSWYEGLEHVVSHKLKLQHNSTRLIVTKLAADSLIFGPIHLLAFFTYMGVTAGKSLDEVKKNVKREFLPAFMTEGMVWPLVQVINFKYVPVRHQLLYVNVFCLLDSAFLSWFKFQDDAPWKRRLVSLVISSDQDATEGKEQ